MTAPRPEWMARLQSALEYPDPEYFARFQPPEEGGRESAVLMLFAPAADGGEDVVLTERSHHLRSHPAQVSFPGGSLEPGDGARAGRPARGARGGRHRPGGRRRRRGAAPALPQPEPAHRDPGPGLVARAGCRSARSTRARCTAPSGSRSTTSSTPPSGSPVHPMGYDGPAFEVDGLLLWGFTAMLLAGSCSSRAWSGLGTPTSGGRCPSGSILAAGSPRAPAARRPSPRRAAGDRRPHAARHPARRAVRQLRDLGLPAGTGGQRPVPRRVPRRWRARACGWFRRPSTLDQSRDHVADAHRRADRRGVRPRLHRPGGRGARRWPAAQRAAGQAGADLRRDPRQRSLVVASAAVLVWFIAGALRGGAPAPWPGRSASPACCASSTPSSPRRPPGSSRASVRSSTARASPACSRGCRSEPIAPIAPPDPNVMRTAGIERAAGSVVKITGVAASCNRGQEGSGWVVAPGRVVTNAHVVAGMGAGHPAGQGHRPVVQGARRRLRPQARPRRGRGSRPARPGARPRNGAQAWRRGRRRRLPARRALPPRRGPRARGRRRAGLGHLRRRRARCREVYSLYARVRPGNSGGPLLSARTATSSASSSPSPWTTTRPATP